MINITLKESNQTTDLSEKTQTPIEIEQQLDISLDSGMLNYLKTENDSKGLNQALAGYSIRMTGEAFDFVGIDSRALLKREANEKKIYSHRVALTEPSKLLQGVLIDGFGVTRPETITYHNSKTVNQTVAVSTVWNEDRVSYEHEAHGSIAVDEQVDEIIDVRGSISVRLSADYNEEQGAILWKATWVDLVQYPKDFTVTITYTYNGPNAATLKDVIKRLLTITPFDGQIFTLTKDASVLQALENVIAPEFKWNTQTTLWECLLQVGAVIDAIPRLVADDKGNYTVVTFDFVNTFVGQVDSIDDDATNAFGENVDESLYNTALSAVVENLRENE